MQFGKRNPQPFRLSAETAGFFVYNDIKEVSAPRCEE